MTLTDPVFTMRDLRVRFGARDGQVDAVKGISFDLHAGRCLALVGESGSGKSVTARAMIGLVGGDAQVDAVELSFGGRDLRRAAASTWRQLRGRHIGFVLQDALTSLDPLRRIEKEVAEPLEIHTNLDRRQRRARVRELLAEAGIPDPDDRARAYPHELSGGLRQRALIASALAAGPELIIADEPTTALDVTVQAQVLDLLAALRDGGSALLLISHDLAVVARMADDVAVMNDGVIVEYGTAERVLHSPEHPYTQALVAASPTIGSRPRKSSGRPFAGSNPPILEVVDISKSYPMPSGARRQAVDQVTFTLRAGGALGIVGESGSGKSTIAQIALGILPADHGTVLLDGEPWSDLSERARRPRRAQIQHIQQDPLSSFDPRFTVERIIAESLGAYGQRAATRRRDDVVALLHLVDLDASVLRRRRSELSGGQRQRVAIARALGPSPAVLVCDEPVSALDVTIQAQILELLATVRRDLGIALLLISHDLGVIDAVCDDVIVMKDGAVVEHGDVDAVLRRPHHPYTRSLLDAVLPDHRADLTRPAAIHHPTEG